MAVAVDRVIDQAFADYEQIRGNRSTCRVPFLVQAWNKGRASMGLDPRVYQDHVCTIDCTNFMDIICLQMNLYGCRLSGLCHICKVNEDDCEVTYTDHDGYHFCMFSGRALGKTIEDAANRRNPNVNRSGGVNHYSPMIKNSPPKENNEIEASSNSHQSPLRVASSSPRTSGGQISMGSPLRTPLSVSREEDDDDDDGEPLRLRSPFDVLGVVGGGSSRGTSPMSSVEIASTPQRKSSGLGLHSTLSKSVPDYRTKTIKGKKRKAGRKRKASNPKRDVKRNDWARDVKKRAIAYLKNSVYYGRDPVRDQPKSEWDDNDDDEKEEEEEEQDHFIPDMYNGICLFTVSIPLYRGYSQDIIMENRFKRGRKSRYSWLGGNFDVKSNSEIESRTDDIIEDLLWDNKIKQEIYDQKLMMAKERTLTRIEMYVKSQLNKEPPVMPNYHVMRNHWVHTINDVVKEPRIESVDLKRKTFYRLLALMLWAFMWEYIEVPAWREKCLERIKKLETTHVGVISPSLTNIPVQPGVSHIQFTTGLLYILKQDGIRLDEECVLPPDEWLQEMLPSTAELDFDLMSVTMRARATSVSKSKKTRASMRRRIAANGGGDVGFPKRRRRRRRKRKKNERNPNSYGRGKRSYTQSNVTEGRNYVKKGLLKLTRLGHAEDIKEAIRVCRQQAEDVNRI